MPSARLPAISRCSIFHRLETNYQATAYLPHSASMTSQLETLELIHVFLIPLLSQVKIKTLAIHNIPRINKPSNSARFIKITTAEAFSLDVLCDVICKRTKQIKRLVITMWQFVNKYANIFPAD